MKPDFLERVGWLMAMSIVALFMHIATREYIDQYWRDELVRRGHAEYVLDDAHNRQWRWKEQVEKP